MSTDSAHEQRASPTCPPAAMPRIVLVLLAAAALAASPVRAQDTGASCPCRADGTAVLLPGDVVVDDADADRVEITAYWRRVPTSEADGSYGSTLLSDGGVGADGVVRFRPVLPHAGRYAVYLFTPPPGAAPLATNATVDVRHAGGTDARSFDQRASAGAWTLLGTYRFDSGRNAFVEIRNDAADGVVVADAVLFRPVAEDAAR